VALVKPKLAWIFLHYLRILARFQLAKINFWRRIRGKKPVVIVGITGSAGKTSTMSATVAALKDSFQVKYSEKANSESGIPLNILGLAMKDYSLRDWWRVAVLSPLKLLTNWQDYDIYVVEMGVDEPYEPKNMSYLLKIIEPQIGVFTSVTAVHSQQFEAAGFNNPQEAIAREKGRLIASLPKNGWAILNRDDPLVWQQAKRTKAKIISVGRHRLAKLRIIRYSVNESETKITYLWRNKKYQLKLSGFVLPQVYAHTFGFALAAPLANNCRLKKAIAIIRRKFCLPPGEFLAEEKTNFLVISSFSCGKFVFSNSRNYF